MDTIEFYNLFAPKRFRRFHCHHFNNEEDGCSHEFYEKYVQGDLKDSKPDFNPLAKAVFMIQSINTKYIVLHQC